MCESVRRQIRLVPGGARCEVGLRDIAMSLQYVHRPHCEGDNGEVSGGVKVEG